MNNPEPSQAQEQASQATQPQANVTQAVPTTQGENQEAQVQATPQPTGSLSEAQSKYLTSQNIKLSEYGIDETNSQAVDAFISGHKKWRVENSKEHQVSLPEVLAQQLNSLGRTQEQEQVQTQHATQPIEQPQPKETTPQPPASGRAINELDILTMKTYLEQNNPELDKAYVGTKAFYDDAANAGYKTINPDGSFNFQQINAFAAIQNDKAKIARLEKELSNRATANIPDVNTSKIDTSIERVKEMDENTAFNIILFNKRSTTGLHPDTARAEAFFNKKNSK